jgi:hypothetical protein
MGTRISDPCGVLGRRDVWSCPAAPSPGGLRHLAPALGVELTARNGRSLYLPEIFAHGVQTLEDDTEVPSVARAVCGLEKKDPSDEAIASTKSQRAQGGQTRPALPDRAIQLALADSDGQR